MNVREKLVELCEDLEILPCCDTYEGQADYLIAHGVTVQAWISVKDRLPGAGCCVLFVCENKSYGVGAYSDTYRCFFSGQFPVENVTHWQYFPQPPKGE